MSERTGGVTLTIVGDIPSAMAETDEPLVTGEFLGLFLVFGADIILVVVILAVAGVISSSVAALVTVAILGVYGGWLGLRWQRLRADSEPAQPDPLETLKDRYAAGELSDDEFEHRLEQLLSTEQAAKAKETDWETERPK